MRDLKIIDIPNKFSAMTNSQKQYLRLPVTPIRAHSNTKSMKIKVNKLMINTLTETTKN